MAKITVPPLRHIRCKCALFPVLHPSAVDLAERHLGVAEAERVIKDAKHKS